MYGKNMILEGCRYGALILMKLFRLRLKGFSNPVLPSADDSIPISPVLVARKIQSGTVLPSTCLLYLANFDKSEHSPVGFYVLPLLEMERFSAASLIEEGAVNGDGICMLGQLPITLFAAWLRNEDMTCLIADRIQTMGYQLIAMQTHAKHNAQQLLYPMIRVSH